MNTVSNENNWLTDPAASRRRTRDAADRFLAYSRRVLANIKQDAERGIPIDPQLIRNLETTIAKHESTPSPSKGGK